MSWRAQLEDLCGAEAVREVPAGDNGAPTLWADVGSEEQLREVVRCARAARRRLLPAGSGAHLPPWAVLAADAIVSLRQLQAIVDHEPQDLTLVAQAGVTLVDATRTLQQHAQELPVMAHPAGQSTLGGAIAGNRAGLDRLQRGSWRDHVLGARVLHTDGSITRTGSRVVKSVSGYDLAKLYVGSRGELTFLLDVNLRLFCAPESTRAVRAMLPAQELPAILPRLFGDRALQPVSILLVRDPSQATGGDGIELCVRFRGRSSVIAAQLQRCRTHVGGEELDEDATHASNERLLSLVEPQPERALLRLVTPPVQVARLVSDWIAQLDAQSGFVAQYGVGVAHLQLSAADVARSADLMAHAATTVPQSWCEWLHAATDVPQPPRATAAAVETLQRAIRSSFDPDGLLVSQHHVSTGEVAVD